MARLRLRNSKARVRDTDKPTASVGCVCPYSCRTRSLLRNRAQVMDPHHARNAGLMKTDGASGVMYRTPLVRPFLPLPSGFLRYFMRGRAELARISLECRYRASRGHRTLVVLRNGGVFRALHSR